MLDVALLKQVEHCLKGEKGTRVP